MSPWHSILPETNIINVMIITKRLIEKYERNSHMVPIKWDEGRSIKMMISSKTTH